MGLEDRGARQEGEWWRDGDMGGCWMVVIGGIEGWIVGAEARMKNGSVC